MAYTHDPFVRGFLSNPPEAIALIDDSFPIELKNLMDLEKLELVRDSFIGNNQNESRTDLLYKVPLKTGSSAYIYLLFEHKSYYDPQIYTQLLKYLSKIYSWQMQKKEDLKVVIPFVFYHGEKGWDLGESFLDSFNKESIPGEFLKFIPNFSIQLLELTSKGKAFETKNLALKLYMRMIQIIRDDPELFLIHLKEIYRALRDEKDEAKRIYILKNLLEYLFRARKDAEKFSEKEITQEIEGDYMNFMEKAILEGELKGKLDNAIETARKMKEEGFTLEQIIRISGLTEEELRKNGIL